MRITTHSFKNDSTIIIVIIFQNIKRNYSKILKIIYNDNFCSGIIFISITFVIYNEIDDSIISYRTNKFRIFRLKFTYKSIIHYIIHDKIYGEKEEGRKERKINFVIQPTCYSINISEYIYKQSKEVVTHKYICRESVGCRLLGLLYVNSVCHDLFFLFTNS